MLKQRILSALVMVAVIMAVLFFAPPQGVTLFFAIVVLGGAWEWANFCGFETTLGRSLYSLLIALLMAAAAYMSKLLVAPDVAVSKEIFKAATTMWAISLLWVTSYPGSAVLWGSAFVRSLLGLFVLLPAWFAASFLGMQDNGSLLIIFALFIVVAADVGAYFAGRAFGKAKLAPNVSPGKSWAGFWGGLALSSACCTGIWFAAKGAIPISLPVLLAVVISTSLASVLGDLMESMLKRHRGIKDSGSVFPGHGGFMDRLDSLSAALPVFGLGYLLSGWGV